MFSILLLLLIGLVFLSHRRRQLFEQKAHSQQLEIELTQKKERLREQLLQRIELTKCLQKAHSHKSQQAEIPAWLQDFMQNNTFTNKAQWQQFKQEFDEAYEGQLCKLKQQHPDLTEAELQYIALAALPLSVEDICFLTNTTNRTIWNRKQNIRKKLSDINLQDLL
ncbi:MAG: hypothetical protein NC038_04455 [Paludibacter sp.]|nr:hypothetical protein [Bacteroidales bacterium]MCM1069391.1 hypothetical protein [Prevotella sp.]MCM1353911.1 hypothetical protein [Bacteroides sp.]MCM1442839.1 hypothetical protein [Muribaculum sp.]MCM1481884.1 hypothetical protein [Paludibacter sp.]